MKNGIGVPVANDRTTGTAVAMATHILALAALLICGADLHPGNTPRRHGVGQSGGKVGGKRGQPPMGPRGECLAQPGIQLGFGQHALHERGLKHVDHMLAIGMRRLQIAAGRRVCCTLVTRPCHHRYHPPTC